MNQDKIVSSIWNLDLPRAPASGSDFVIYEYGQRILLCSLGDGAFRPFRREDLGPLAHARGDEEYYLGKRADRAVYYRRAAIPLFQGHEMSSDECLSLSLRELISHYGWDDWVSWICRGRQILDWHSQHRFCGLCGHETRPSREEWARFCTSCGHHFYPRLNPAVITLVTRGPRILLLRHKRGGGQYYSLSAGFVEAGENLENAVKRELWEEAGVEVGQIRYLQSQIWPFPASLMMGFQAEYEGGELRPQPGEILEARWFYPDELPSLPPRGSIASTMIDFWLNQRSWQNRKG